MPCGIFGFVAQDGREYLEFPQSLHRWGDVEGELETFMVAFLPQASPGTALAVERKASATSRNSLIT